MIKNAEETLSIKDDKKKIESEPLETKELLG